MGLVSNRGSRPQNDKNDIDTDKSALIEISLLIALLLLFLIVACFAIF